MINVLIAFNSTQIDAFLDNFRFDANGDRLRTDFAPFDADGVTLDPYNPAHLNVNLQSDGMWKAYEAPGPNTTILESMLVADVVIQVPDDQTQVLEPKLAMVEYLRSQFDARFQVMGSWRFDGEMGQDEEEKLYYALNPNYLKWMPDDVTYDQDGNETSRTDATEFKDVNLYLGQTPRLIV